MTAKILFTSESVTEWHPDKICDQISDSILDACLAQDPDSRVACECLITTNKLIISWEITSKAKVDYEAVARKTIVDIWYDSDESFFDWNTCEIEILIDNQSPDIALGVNTWGAGDQWMMFGYASNETENFMPMSIDLAHKLSYNLSKLRKDWILDFLRPDWKTQVTVEYLNNKIKRVDTVVVSTQHNQDISQEDLQNAIKKELIYPTLADLIDDKTIIHINPTWSFYVWWPVWDTWLTGRKIIVDTYWWVARHWWWAFSGKDPSKVDRSAAYMARYLAKNIVAAGLCDRCEIQIAYAIWVAQPVNIFLEDFGTAKIEKSKILQKIHDSFDLSPQWITNHLQLKRAIYQKTASYGHFGRDEFSWEKLDSLELFADLLQ